MERIFFRDRSVWAGDAQAEESVWNLSCREEKKKIAVVGISQGAGTTFVAMSLAFLLSKNVEKEQKKARNGSDRADCMAAGAAYVELRQPRAGEAAGFFGAGLDLRFRVNRFTDFFRIYMQGQPLPPRVNLHKGINWIVWRSVANTGETAATDDVMKIAENDAPQPSLLAFPLEELAGEWIVADNPPLEMLHRFDMVIGVIDPLPSRVFAGTETYEHLRDLCSSGMHILWVVNCDNTEVNHGELRRFLRLKEYHSIPLTDQAVFYRAQYESCLPVEIFAAYSLNKISTPYTTCKVYEALDSLARKTTAFFTDEKAAAGGRHQKNSGLP